MWGGRVCLVLLFFLLLLPLPSRAAELPTLAIPAGEAFAVDLTSISPLGNYRAKICFSEKEDPQLTECEGETWNGEEWLQRTNAWELFLPRSSQSFLVARSDGMSMYPFVHVVFRSVIGPQNSFIAKTWHVQWQHGERLVSVASQETVPLFLRISTDANEWLAPFFNGWAQTHINSERFSVTVLDGSNHIVKPAKEYRLVGEGGYTIALESFLVRSPYVPKIVGPAITYDHQATEYFVQTNRAIEGEVEWFVDGERVSSGSRLVYTFLFPSFHTVAVMFPETDERVELPVEVREVGALHITRFVANPAGVDYGNHEEVTVKNDNDFVVPLAGWYLLKRGDTRKIGLSGSIAPHEASTNFFSSKLVNSGATYELYNPNNSVVDSFSYEEAVSGAVYEREGLTWHMFLPNDLTSSPIDEKTNVIGRVVKPSGRSIDLVTASGQNVHIVVHKSFDRERPRLHTGDVIHVSGEWRKSRSGYYLSVRAGDAFFVVTPAPRSLKTKKKSKADSSPTKSKIISHTLVPPLVDVAKAADRQVVYQPGQTVAFRFFLLRSFLALCFAAGVVFLLPFGPPRRV